VQVVDGVFRHYRFDHGFVDQAACPTAGCGEAFVCDVVLKPEPAARAAAPYEHLAEPAIRFVIARNLPGLEPRAARGRVFARAR
jgi:hypothetical protein